MANPRHIQAVVIDLDDTLEAKPLSYVEIGSESLSGNRVALTASLADDGGQAIYVARIEGVAIPAVSGTGLGVMLLFIVAVGGFVFSRAKRQAA